MLRLFPQHRGDATHGCPDESLFRPVGGCWMNEAIGPKRGILAGARTRELFNSTGLRALFAVGLVAALIGAAGPADAAVPSAPRFPRRIRKRGRRRHRFRRVRSTSSCRSASSASRSTPTARRSPARGFRPAGAASRHRPACSASSRKIGIIVPISTVAHRCPTCSGSHGRGSRCMPGRFRLSGFPRLHPPDATTLLLTCGPQPG